MSDILGLRHQEEPPVPSEFGTFGMLKSDLGNKFSHDSKSAAEHTEKILRFVYTLKERLSLSGDYSQIEERIANLSDKNIEILSGLLLNAQNLRSTLLQESAPLFRSGYGITNDNLRFDDSSLLEKANYDLAKKASEAAHFLTVLEGFCSQERMKRSHDSIIDQNSSVLFGQLKENVEARRQFVSDLKASTQEKQKEAQAILEETGNERAAVDLLASFFDKVNTQLEIFAKLSGNAVVPPNIYLGRFMLDVSSLRETISFSRSIDNIGDWLESIF